MGFQLIFQVKVLPLRLHIDQDALDFLKRFFSFKVQSNASSPEMEMEVPTPVIPAEKGTELFFRESLV